MSRYNLGTAVSLPAHTFKFLREVREELRKVFWPSREDTVRYTLIVIVSSVGLGLFIGGVDYVLSLGIKQLI